MSPRPLDWLRSGDPARSALSSERERLDARTLAERIGRLAEALRAARIRVLASRMDNGPAWAVVDLAAWEAGVVHVPLPSFFSDAQVTHALHAAGVDALVTVRDDSGSSDDLPERGLQLLRLDAAPVAMPAGTVKVSFTSGSTGTPKGACLSGEALARVAHGVATAMAPIAVRRHLVVLPLPVLLENIAGLYAPLVAGAAVVIPPTATVGLEGSSGFDPGRLQAAVEHWSPDSVIVLPQMLRAWSAWRAQRMRCTGAASAAGGLLGAPRFVAVGGAAVGAATVGFARACGLPAHEGYGLTEGASVQALNLPGADRPGTVGRALPHARLRISQAGEVEVAGTPMLGYLGEPSWPPIEWWPTGDLGAIDDAGFLHLAGRRTNLLVTGFGRNVSPEWVETALQSQPAIAHAVVFGDGRPALCAVIWPARKDTPSEAVDAAVAAANRMLPDYARVRHIVPAARAFDPSTGLATPNGRPRRAAIESLHRAAIAAAYAGHPDHVVP